MGANIQREIGLDGFLKTILAEAVELAIIPVSPVEELVTPTPSM